MVDEVDLRQDQPVQYRDEDFEEVKCDKCPELVIKFFRYEHTCKKQKVKCPLQPCSQEFDNEKEISDHLQAHELNEAEEKDYTDKLKKIESDLNQVNNPRNQEEIKSPQIDMMQNNSNSPHNQLHRNSNQSSDNIHRHCHNPQHHHTHNRQPQQDQRMRHLQNFIHARYSNAERGGNFRVSFNHNQMLINQQNRPDMFSQVYRNISNRDRPEYVGGVSVANMTDEQIYDFFTNLDLKLNSKPLKADVFEQLPEQVFQKHEHNQEQLSQAAKDSLTQENSCMICMSEFEEGEQLKTLTCFHKYHKECIKEWFKNQSFCPICRTEIKS